MAAEQEQEGNKRNIILGYSVVEDMRERLVRIEEKQAITIGLEVRVRLMETAMAVLQSSPQRNDRFLLWGSTLVTLGIAAYAAFIKH